MPEVVQFEIDPVLCEKITVQAARQNISVNQLIVDAINLYLEMEKEREWRAGFEAMGQDPDMNNVDSMLPAAREVVFRDTRSA